MVRMLLDTCVISEVRRPQGHEGVRHHIAQLDPDTTYLSVITMGEIAKGLHLLPDGQRKRSIASWAFALEQQFSEQILPVDTATAHLWGELTARAQSNGIQIPSSDGLIAATAIRHGLHVMTRNTRDFAATGAMIIDPWKS